MKKLALLTRGRTFQAIDLRALEEPYARLQDAQKVFQGHLSKKHSTDTTASRFRRRTWILQRSRIRQITRDIITIRNQVSAAIQSLILYAIHLTFPNMNNS